MAKRKSISEKIRFEVLKRDKFTCQYCGKSEINDVNLKLEIDHIVPVKEGGDNNILNLVTSCFSCNRGKGAIKLDNNIAISKQKKQADALQDKLEDRKLIFKWHKELEGIDIETNNDVIKYINEKMYAYTVSDGFINKFKKIIKKYNLEDILEAVDTSAKTYLKYDNNGDETEESSLEFVNKIGGILYNMNQPIVKQKISYIKGICRNRFNNFDIRVGSIILNAYIKALEDYGCDEEIIVTDLDIDVIPITKEASSWSELRNIIEKWTDDVRRWTQERLEEEATSV